jgi:hypothetical protein
MRYSHRRTRTANAADVVDKFCFGAALIAALQVLAMPCDETLDVQRQMLPPRLYRIR